ncbi:hypothetical protein BD289DRAFT_484714 [Coniella lustricola]|uniref:Uncharacterized protein n=1 Tax=Coniella lustricola TaxID=2025994 RepID=A0A2T3A140_9PEZI|nr:hypothetical protein BD289DRAFT_484714 [Coniella lustricola]
MAPSYRTNPNTRRGARGGFPEHDDFEGLPTRQWRKTEITIAPPQETEENKKNDRWAVELPHGMPKDSDQLPTHSLNLLRLARSGRLYKRANAGEDDDGDGDGLPGDKADKKGSATNEGFKLQVWKQVPRSAEGPTISYLAKRKPGTITLPSKSLLALQATGPTITKAIVKRNDAAGNSYTQEVTITPGVQVDGEIISTSVVPAPEPAATPSAAGTPIRRKPPVPQKKKGRGRGRGRGRARAPLATPTRTELQASTSLDGASDMKTEVAGPDVSRALSPILSLSKQTPDYRGNKIKSEFDKTSGDIEMMDSPAVDDEGEEGEGDGDDDEEGEGDETGTPAYNDDQEMEDAPTLPPSSAAADSALSSTAPAPDAAETSLGLTPLSLNPLASDVARNEGSPLKNVVIPAPAAESSPKQTPAEQHPAESLPITALPTDSIPVDERPTELSSSLDVAVSNYPGESTLGLQPLPVQEQVLQSTVAVSIPDVITEDAQPTQPLAVASPQLASEEMISDEAIIQADEPEIREAETQEPEVQESESQDVIMGGQEDAEPVAVEQQPSPETAEEQRTEPLRADVPIPTSEEPMPGQVLEKPAVPEPQETSIESAPLEPAPVESAPAEPAPVEPVSVEAARDEPPATLESVQTEPAVDVPTTAEENATADENATAEENADEGSDLLGPLDAALNQQAEDDAPTSVPSPPSAPIPEQDPVSETVDESRAAASPPSKDEQPPAEASNGEK